MLPITSLVAPTIHYGQDGRSAKADRSVAEQALAMLTDESGRFSIAQQHDAYRLYREHKWAMNGEERSEASAQIHNSSYGQRTAELENKLGELHRSLANGNGDSISNAKRTIAWFDSLPEWERNHPRLEGTRERNLAAIAMFEALEKREAAGAYKPGQPTSDPEAKLILQLFEKLGEAGKADSPWAKAFEPYLQRGREMLEEDRRSRDVVELSETARDYMAAQGAGRGGSTAGENRSPA